MFAKESVDLAKESVDTISKTLAPPLALQNEAKFKENFVIWIFSGSENLEINERVLEISRQTSTAMWTFMKYPYHNPKPLCNSITVNYVEMPLLPPLNSLSEATVKSEVFLF